MKPSSLARAAAFSLALACAALAPASSAQAPPGPESVSRQQESSTARAIPAPRLVAALGGYTGPSLFGGRPALAAFSPDGRLLALSGEGRSVKLYEAATGKLLLTLAGDKEGDGFNGFAFVGDSRVGATRNLPDRSVSLWDLSNGKLLRTFAGRERDIETKVKATHVISAEFFAVPLSPDGRAVLTEREDDIVVAWDAADGRELFALEHRTETSAAKDVLGMFFGIPPRPLLMSAAFSPDGARVVTVNGDKSPKLWDAATGRLVAALASEGRNDHTYAASFLPAAGALLTVAIGGEVNLWDASTGALRKQLVPGPGDRYVLTVGHDSGRVTHSRDGRLVASQDKREVTVWDAADGATVATLRQNRSKLLVFSPDGRTLAAAGGDKRSTAQLWDVAAGRLKLSLARTEGEARSLLFSPDGRLLVTTSDKGVRLWDAETGALVATLDRARPPARFSPDGRLLVTGGTDKTAYLYALGP